MKLILSLTLLLASAAFSETLPFGAFTHKNQLYVTILGDCNNASAALVVEPLCNKNRHTDNYADKCSAEVIVATTRMLCPEGEPLTPKVFAFDLSKEAVASEAVDLTLKYQEQAIEIKINK